MDTSSTKFLILCSVNALQHLQANVKSYVAVYVRIKEESLTVIASSPAQMADNARKTVANLLRKGVTRIEYCENSLQW